MVNSNALIQTIVKDVTV